MYDGKIARGQQQDLCNPCSTLDQSPLKVVAISSSLPHLCERLSTELHKLGVDVRLIFKGDIKHTAADLLLVDVGDMSFADLEKLLIKSACHHKRVGLINAPHDECGALVSRFGVICGVFCGPPKTTDLLKGIKALLEGEQWLPRNAMAESIARYRKLVSSASSAERLSSRERQIMLLAAKGMTNQEIADAVGLKLPTVKNHVHHALIKLEASNRAQGASMCLAYPEVFKRV